MSTDEEAQINSDSSSISVLSLIFSDGIELNNKECAAESIVPHQYPDVVGPDFIGFEIHVPSKFERFLKMAQNIYFVYKIIESEYLQFEYNMKKELKYFVYMDYYGTFDFTKEVASDMIFLIGREKYKADVKAALNKNFRKCIATGEVFECVDEYEARYEQTIAYQLAYNKNFVFINDANDFVNKIKQIAVLLLKDKTYYPKTKTFFDNMNNQFYYSLLCTIPGCSAASAEAIIKRFSTLAQLAKAITESPDEVKSISIEDPKSKRRRTLGKTLFKKLHVLFTDESGTARLKDI
ncbi:hypothetical protein ENBRE01_0679 [Enteropsectra breve]|nr:hypothetical protein ENBRE01_0679 [Enteropsectra breve]